MPKIITEVDSNIRRYRARFCKPLEIKLETPEQVDSEIADWMKKAYELAE